MRGVPFASPRSRATPFDRGFGNINKSGSETRIIFTCQGRASFPGSVPTKSHFLAEKSDRLLLVLHGQTAVHVRIPSCGL